ncbi:MAG: glycosyltransferase [Bacteroidetes bacterium]|nr:glycosyltransferase [Bacteroidota bacterium]
MSQFDIVFALSGDLNRNARALKQLRSLAAAGYEVQVLHPGGSAPEVPLPASIHADKVAIPAGSGPKWFKAVNEIFRQHMMAFRPSVFHASDLYVLSAARAASRQTGAYLTYDAREYYPHVAGTKGKPWARWWWARTERKSIRHADAVFTVSDSIADALKTDYGIPRPLLVYNAPDEDEPVRVSRGTDNVVGAELVDSATGTSPNLDIRALINAGDAPVMVHLGQMKRGRGGTQLIAAMTKVPDAHLVFLGFGSESEILRKMASESPNADRIHFLDPVPPDEVRRVIASADIGITMLEDICLNHRYALPNKLFDYIHAGLPVLGSDLDEVRRIIRRYDIGMTTDATDPEQIGRAMATMLHGPEREMWKVNTRRAAETFRWESASQTFLGAFRALLPAEMTRNALRNP